MPGPQGTVGRRWLWFVVLWLAGVAVLGVIAFGLRAVLL